MPGSMDAAGMMFQEPPSILDDLGEEVTGIMAPVSICMAITVALVRILNPDGTSSSSNSVVIASLAYDENSQDSSGQKFGGALLNALIFVGIMAGMTFVLVLLFKYGCFKIIYGYMAFAVFDIFFLITSLVAIQVLQALDIHVDAFSFVFGLYNFGVVGTVGILFIPMPLLAKQFYMLWTGVITAYIFTWVPEWTSWVLIVVMALYDIAAVLIPGGPLNMLIKVATERQEMLPALVYEARPARGPYVANQMVRRDQRAQDGQGVDDVETGEPLATSAYPDASTDNSRQGTGGGGGYRPPEVAEVAPGSGSLRGAAGAADAGGSGSPRRGPSTHMSGPLVPGGSSQILPMPHGGGGSGSGRTGPGSRPGSAGSGGGAGKKSDGSQEMSATSRFAAGAGAAGGDARASAGSVRGSGSVVHRSNSWARQQPGGSGAGPVGEGVEDEMAAGAYKALPALAPELPHTSQHHQPQPVDLTAQALGRGAQASHSLPPIEPGRLGSGGAPDPLGSRRSGSGPSAGNPLASPAQSPTGGYDPSAYAPQPQSITAGQGVHSPPAHQPPPSDPGAVEIELPDSIKLGLGDFIFYSMLVGRAAMYDYMTVFASYIGIIAGLGITLVCLAAFQRALPALPFSIALGVIFYFLTRLVLEPFIVPLATSLTFF